MKVKLKTNELRKILARKNKSQNWLSHKLFISSGHMSQLMNSARHPSPKIRERIMNVLQEFSFDDLFIIEDED